jgi:hypothetical protein
MLTTFGEHKRRYDVLMTQLAIASRHLNFFWGLWANYEKLSKDLFWCRDFWDATTSAHMNAMLVNLCRVYDDHKCGINLLTFLRKVKSGIQKSPQWLLVDQIDASQLAADISVCEARPGKFGPSMHERIALIDRLRKWRNKIVAHYEDQVAIFDSERFRLNYPWEIKDFETLIAQGVAILDRYSFSERKDVRYTEALAGLGDREIAAKVVCRLAAGGERE